MPPGPPTTTWQANVGGTPAASLPSQLVGHVLTPGVAPVIPAHNCRSPLAPCHPLPPLHWPPKLTIPLTAPLLHMPTSQWLHAQLLRPPLNKLMVPTMHHITHCQPLPLHLLAHAHPCCLHLPPGPLPVIAILIAWHCGPTSGSKRFSSKTSAASARTGPHQHIAQTRTCLLALLVRSLEGKIAHFCEICGDTSHSYKRYFV